MKQVENIQEKNKLKKIIEEKKLMWKFATERKIIEADVISEQSVNKRNNKISQRVRSKPISTSRNRYKSMKDLGTTFNFQNSLRDRFMSPTHPRMLKFPDIVNSPQRATENDDSITEENPEQIIVSETTEEQKVNKANLFSEKNKKVMRASYVSNPENKEDISVPK